MSAPAFLPHTKFHFPSARATLVPRPRLLALLDHGLARPLTLLSAPAGFGKTTLLGEWRASESGRGFRAAWLALDADDNEAARFAAGLAAAVGSLQPGLGEAALSALQSPQRPPLNAVLTALLNDLGGMARPALLVLDDYHLIHAQAVHDAVAYLLDHLPAPLRMVIATRSDPPLPLARLRARDQLLEIRAGQLRFTPGEAAAFLAQAMGLALAPEDAATLAARTEGWAAGLQMAALSMRGRTDLAQFVRAFSGSHRYIVDYLVEEALHQQPDEVQAFLMATSILDRFSSPLCAEVLAAAEPACRATLAYLDRANVFLVPLDDERGWYRYHHLFADLLRARLAQGHPERVPELHRRASHWHERNGSPAEAVRHALFAYDGERAAELIERHGPAGWSLGDPGLLRMAERLPPEKLKARPRLGLYQAWLWMSQGQTSAAQALLQDLGQRLPSRGSDTASAWMGAVVDLLTATISDLGTASAPARLPDHGALARIPDSDSGLRSTAAYLYAGLLGRRGRFERAAEILEASIRGDMAGRETIAITMGVPPLARIRVTQGRLPEAARLCRDYLRLAAERPHRLLYGAGSLNQVLGEVLYEWNELEAAEGQVRAGMEANAPWQNLLLEAVGLTGLASVQQARGDLEGARETLHRLEAILDGQPQLPDLLDEFSSVRVRLWLATGDLARAGAWADQRHATQPADHLQAWGGLALARVRLAQGRYAEVQHVLEALAELPGSEERPHRQIHTRALLALALAGQSQWPQALAALEACLAQAEPGGYCRAFLDCGEPARELLAAYLRTPAPPHMTYARKLLDAFPVPPRESDSATPRTAGAESLTGRELDVLRLIAEGCSNREIAERLVLAEGTVKFHVHSVLEKLHVRSRTQAIARARERRLI